FTYPSIPIHRPVGGRLTGGSAGYRPSDKNRVRERREPLDLCRSAEVDHAADTVQGQRRYRAVRARPPAQRATTDTNRSKIGALSRQLRYGRANKSVAELWAGMRRHVLDHAVGARPEALPMGAEVVCRAVRPRSRGVDGNVT